MVQQIYAVCYRNGVTASQYKYISFVNPASYMRWHMSLPSWILVLLLAVVIGAGLWWFGKFFLIQ